MLQANNSTFLGCVTRSFAKGLSDTHTQVKANETDSHDSLPSVALKVMLAEAWA